jgi:hypothetical protein
VALLSESDLESVLKDELIPAFLNEKEKLKKLDRWYRWDPEDVKIPRGASPELKALLALSRTPWLGLVVTSTAQCLFVDGYRSALDPVEDPDGDRPMPIPGQEPVKVPDKPILPEGPWEVWLANQLDKRQTAIYRAALAYGYSYATVLPGEDFRGESMPVIRGVSPRKMWAVYEDPASDDWPVYAMQVVSEDNSGMKVRVFDDEHVYTVVVPNGPKKDDGSDPGIVIKNTELHNAGICPVVRYCNELDLDGRTPGEIEPHIPLASRINKTSYDRMLVQHFNSWKIRWIAGLEAPDSERAKKLEKQKLSQDDFLILEDADTKIGSLPETSLDGFIRAHENDVQALAAVTQTPTHELTGQLINLSAEALAAARASQGQKVAESQHSFGASHAQALRLASQYRGDEKHAKDITGRCTWQDTSIRSIAQAVDALGKAATMLHIPDQALWSRIPGVEKSDVQEWIRMARQMSPIQEMQATAERQAAPVKPKGVVGNDPVAKEKVSG